MTRGEKNILASPDNPRAVGVDPEDCKWEDCKWDAARFVVQHTPTARSSRKRADGADHQPMTSGFAWTFPARSSAADRDGNNPRDGGEGNDMLRGGRRDVLSGGPGDDVLDRGAADDLLT